MIDLKKIITQLDIAIYQRLEETMVKSKADNSLYLLKSYRNDNIHDTEIIEHLKINSNSLYTLKSRLYDKIQSQLTNQDEIAEKDLISQVNQVHIICYNNSKEIAVAFLTKLEEGLLAKDMHGELLIVYSALKQLHLFSDKYFHYSQLYNKQIAFSLTTEKSIEILGNFNRMLMQYDFSKSDSDAETLYFLYKGIQEQYSLNPSKQIELIRSIIEIELNIFCKTKKESLAFEPVTLLKRAYEIIEELPENFEQKQWIPALNFLSFEYYNQINDTKNSKLYFELVDKCILSLPFYSNISLVSKFLISKINYLQKTEIKSISNLEIFDTGIIDQKNSHSIIITSLYNAVVCYHQGKLKEAIAILNNLLNNISLKDLHFINIEIKLTLAFFYIKKKDFDLAETLLKSISRKIKSEELQMFAYVNNLIKLLMLEMTPKGKNTKEQQADMLTLFVTKNQELNLFGHLISEFINQYQS